MATVAQHVISSCPVVIPPLAEQETIARWIETQWSRISQAIEHAHREVVLLTEYRTRLIADVVTGNLDVREAASHLPDKIEEPESSAESDGFANVAAQATGGLASVAGEVAL